ncbi:hypothetical protein Nos7524_3904 [Nostoc sp. PCC 7524]|nr:hypothetical protein Nos7524_3904 [Nostoc sp. PCC 7524]
MAVIADYAAVIEAVTAVKTLKGELIRVVRPKI